MVTLGVQDGGDGDAQGPVQAEPAAPARGLEVGQKSDILREAAPGVLAGTRW